MPNIVQMETTRTETITIWLKNEKMTHDGTINESLKPWSDFTGDGFGLPYKQMRFMSGEELRDIGDRRVLDTYISDQNYICSQETSNCETYHEMESTS